jgi:signal peptidase I
LSDAPDDTPASREDGAPGTSSPASLPPPPPQPAQTPSFADAGGALDALGREGPPDAGDVVPADPPPPADRGALSYAIDALQLPVATPADLRRERPGASGLAILRDNLEAVAFALILALMLRHSVVEVFKIPTSSMEPTLFGDNSSTHPGTPGDRILVMKDAYLFKDPARWDVVVFHYPLDWSRDFIKRVVAGPDEAVRIERGDIWVGDARRGDQVTLRPARKPRRVREQLWFPVYPPKGRHEALRPDVWWREVGGGGSAGTLAATGHGVIRYEGDRAGARPVDGSATLRYGVEIRDDSRPTSDPERSMGMNHVVCDVRVRCRVRAEGSAEVEFAWTPGDRRRQAVRLASADRGGSTASTRGASRPLGVALAPGRAVDVEVESVDGDLRVTIDGDEVAVIPDELSVEEAVEVEGLGSGAPARELTVSARGAAVTIDEVRLDRDLYYTNWRDGQSWPQRGQNLVLGSDEFFVLGDNTQHSSDARRWAASGVRLKDGRRVMWEWQISPSRTVEGDRTWREVVDIEGVRRRWLEEDEAETEPQVRMPFVKRDRIVGKAWFALVFWPLKDVLPRIRFVH